MLPCPSGQGAVRSSAFGQAPRYDGADLKLLDEGLLLAQVSLNSQAGQITPTISTYPVEHPASQFRALSTNSRKTGEISRSVAGAAKSERKPCSLHLSVLQKASIQMSVGKSAMAGQKRLGQCKSKACRTRDDARADNARLHRKILQRRAAGTRPSATSPPLSSSGTWD